MNYVVLEGGNWELADGTKLQVGKMNTDATVGKQVSNTWADVAFSDVLPFTSAPVVLSQVQTPTGNDTEWVKTRQKNIIATGFKVALEEAEMMTTTHGSARQGRVIGWLAIEGGMGTWNGHVYEAGKTGAAVTDAWYSISFGQSFGQAPRFVASMATYNGPDNSGLRYQSLGQTSVQVKVEEDTTLNDGTGHSNAEDVHYLAIEGDGALTEEVPTTETKYYYFNGQRIAMRRDGVLYYLVGDHLGTTSLVLDAEGNKVAESRHLPYGEERWSSGTLPTDYRFTGQRLESSLGSVYHMGARFYDSYLNRFLSPDSIIPQFANPQSFNRYSYVNNRPLVAIDPTGHDLMIVGGYDNDNWEDPSEWMEWIMAYKGWSKADWDQFYGAWKAGDEASRTQLMNDNSIYLFDWTACDCADKILAWGDDPHQNASREAYVKDMLSELEAQLSGLKDVTLLGHSKGGNLVLNYMQRNGKYVKNAVTIDALWKHSGAMYFARGMKPILDDTGHPFYANTSANNVNIYNSGDWVNSGAEGYYNGDVVNLRVDESENYHSTKGWLASYTLYREFNVALDHGARGWLVRGR